MANEGPQIKKNHDLPDEERDLTKIAATGEKRWPDLDEEDERHLVEEYTLRVRNYGAPEQFSTIRSILDERMTKKFLDKTDAEFDERFEVLGLK